MKQIFLTLIVTLVCIFSISSQTVTINGDSSRPDIPINATEKYSYSQFIYLGDEINYSGLIRSITFKLLGKMPTTLINQLWKVNLAEIVNDDFSNTQTNPWLAPLYKPYEGLVEVYNDYVFYDPKNKTVKIVFKKPFFYHKSKNLLVEVYKYADGETNNIFFKTNNKFSKKRGIITSSNVEAFYDSSSRIRTAVNSVPAVDIEIMPSSTSMEQSLFEYCEGDNLELTAEDAGTEATYLWTLPDASIIENKDLTINNLSKSHEGIYILEVVKKGCSNLALLELKVNKLPVFNLSKFEVCVGQELNLIDFGSQSTSRIFLSSDENIATVTDEGVVKAIKSGITFISYENKKGCKVKKKLIVNDMTLPTLTSNLSSDTTCYGALVEFIASGGIEYEFMVNGIKKQLRSTSHIFKTVSLNDGDKVKVKAWNKSGCSFESLESTIKVKRAPYINKIEGKEEQLCEGEDAYFIIDGMKNSIVTYAINSGALKKVTLFEGSAIVKVSNVETSQEIHLKSVSLDDCQTLLNNKVNIEVTSRPIAIIKNKS